VPFARIKLIDMALVALRLVRGWRIPIVSAMLRPAPVLFALLTALTGLVYLMIATGIWKLGFPAQVPGSLVVRDQHVVGSSLLAQSFQQPRYFWGRVSDYQVERIARALSARRGSTY
jgi:K+-transporting ATPase c subunit